MSGCLLTRSFCSPQTAPPAPSPAPAPAPTPTPAPAAANKEEKPVEEKVRTLRGQTTQRASKHDELIILVVAVLRRFRRLSFLTRSPLCHSLSRPSSSRLRRRSSPSIPASRRLFRVGHLLLHPRASLPPSQCPWAGLDSPAVTTRIR